MGCLNHSSILIDIAIEVSHHLHDKLVVDVRASGWCCSGQMFAINDRGYRFCLWKLSKGFKTVWRWAPHEVSEAAAQGFEDEGMRPVKQTYSETNIHTYVHTYIHTYIHTDLTDKHTYIHTCIHTYIHTYIKTCMHTLYCTCYVLWHAPTPDVETKQVDDFPTENFPA